MSRFACKRCNALSPYTPGEQPHGREYIKLNTNESPYPPIKEVELAVSAQARSLQLYSDPESKQLTLEAARVFGVKPECLLMTNGSDEILNFAVAAFCDETHPLAFPDITYGFYPVFAALYGVPYTTLKLREDFTVEPSAYMGINKNIFLANPNAPTGLSVAVSQIEQIVRSNPDNIVLIDEAYVDFGGQTCLPLINKYDNLIITRTFSKSYSMAGARLGFGIANSRLIEDMNKIKYSTNPYNVNSLTAAAGIAAIKNNAQFMENCKQIIKTRAFTKQGLEKLGFTMPDSDANFLFARSSRISGLNLYLRLKEKGVLVRHFNADRINDYNRITIGTRQQMETLLSKIEEIYREDNL